jgi:hypothetical protein
MNPDLYTFHCEPKQRLEQDPDFSGKTRSVQQQIYPTTTNTRVQHAFPPKVLAVQITLLILKSETTTL